MAKKGSWRGWIRKSARHSESAQREALEAAGYDPIYVASETVTLAKFIKSLRAGNRVGVTTLGRLASRRDLVRAAIQDIHSQKAIIHEVETGRLSNDKAQLGEMIFDCADELGGDKKVHGPKAAKKYGKMGGRPPTEDRMPDPLAEREWFDSRNKRIKDALDKMWGWSERAAYREFGPRNIYVGRRRGK